MAGSIKAGLFLKMNQKFRQSRPSKGAVGKWHFGTMSCCDIQSVTVSIVGSQSFPDSLF